MGPFKIEKRIGELASRRELPADRRIHDVFHVSKLKLYVPNPSELDGRPTKPAPVAFSKEGEEIFEVESIVDRRWVIFPNRVKPEWGDLVHWKNHDESERTWLPIENLSGSKRTVENYNKSNPIPTGASMKKLRPKLLTS